MSEEQLKAFLEAVKADAGLQDKLKAAADADAVVAIAKTAGFVISTESSGSSQGKGLRRGVGRRGWRKGGHSDLYSLWQHTLWLMRDRGELA